MAEVLAMQGRETLSQEQKTPPALQELKKLIGPNNISVVAQAYEGFSDAGKTSLLQKIQENMEGVNTFVELEDDTSLQTLLKKIILDINKTEAVAVKTEAVAVKTEAVAVKTEAVAVKTEAVAGKSDIEKTDRVESKKLTERLEEARIINQKVYALFGNEAGFKNKFKDQIGGWTEQAAKAIGIDPEKANKGQISEEEKTKLDVSLLVTNRDAIAAALPEWVERKAFHQFAGQLNGIAEDLGIPHEKTFSKVVYTASEKNKLTTELIGLKPTDRVTQTGSEFRYGNDRDGYQIVDMSTNPPTRSIEQNGIRIAESVRTANKKKEYYARDEQYQAAYEGIENEIRTIEGDVKSEISFLKQYADRLNLGSVDKLDSSTYDRILQALGKELQGAEKGTPEYEDIDRLGKQIHERKQKYLEQGGLQERQQKLAELIRKRDSLEIEKILHRERYLNTLESETESNRFNLEYIGSTHLTALLGDSGIKLLMEQINETTPDKFSHLALETKWWRKEKELFSGGLRKLLGLDTTSSQAFFESDGYTIKRYAPDMKTPMETLLKERLQKNGVYGGIPPAVIQEQLVRVMNGERSIW